jgi:hypothetical protein
MDVIMPNELQSRPGWGQDRQKKWSIPHRIGFSVPGLEDDCTGHLADPPTRLRCGTAASGRV